MIGQHKRRNINSAQLGLKYLEYKAKTYNLIFYDLSYVNNDESVAENIDEYLPFNLVYCNVIE